MFKRSKKANLQGASSIHYQSVPKLNRKYQATDGSIRHNVNEEEIKPLLQDNDNGVQPKLLGNISPIFITKHTGEGTGPRLSIRYDIVDPPQ